VLTTENGNGMHVNETSISIHIMICCLLLTFLCPPSFVKVKGLKEVFCLVNRVVYSQWMYVIQIHTAHVRTGPQLWSSICWLHTSAQINSFQRSFTFMHFQDAFIQVTLQCIQVTQFINITHNKLTQLMFISK